MAWLSHCQKLYYTSWSLFSVGYLYGFLGFEIFGFALEVGFGFPFLFYF